ISFFLSSRRRHTRSKRDWSSDVCSSDLEPVDQEFTRTPGDSTELETEAPETTTPGEITESTAEPTRPGPACTNFAGGALRWPVKVGHWSLYRLKTGWIEIRSMWAS